MSPVSPVFHTEVTVIKIIKYTYWVDLNGD